MTEKVCVDPSASEVPCCICGKLVKPCSSEEPVDGPDGCDYCCPVHQDGCELSDGRWVCSEKCWDEAVRRVDLKHIGVYKFAMLMYATYAVFSLLVTPTVYNVSVWLALVFAGTCILAVRGFLGAYKNWLQLANTMQEEADG
ncbi:MAG: hypothetical protein NTX82_04290 [Candidatus Parcubacteria bacterium]|nr:hypothetical protein [Candidatus Parcubacteria bacterium]